MARTCLAAEKMETPGKEGASAAVGQVVAVREEVRAAAAREVAAMVVAG